MAATGELALLGRREDWINVGGKKVNPREVEAVLKRLDGIDDAVVFGFSIPGREGEAVRAVLAGIRVCPGISKWWPAAARRWPPHKVPRSVLRVAGDPAHLARQARLAPHPRPDPRRTDRKLTRRLSPVQRLMRDSMLRRRTTEAARTPDIGGAGHAHHHHILPREQAGFFTGVWVRSQGSRKRSGVCSRP